MEGLGLIGQDRTAAARDGAPHAAPDTPVCPACGGTHIDILYEVDDIPVHSCVLLDTPEEAKAFPRANLKLGFCETCGFAFNTVFDEEAMGYSTNFEESQHFSGTFNAFARELAGEIGRSCGLNGNSHVLEIGCGKGEFLLELCALTGSRGLGIDPGYRPDRVADRENARVEFIPGVFDPAHNYPATDVILCRHTLEHIAGVSDFIGDIARMAQGRKDISVVFETPDALRVFRDGAFWDIYHEHCSYFSPGAHARLFRAHGLDVTGLELVYDRQYIVQYAKPAEGEPGTHLALEDDLSHMRALAHALPLKIAAVQRKWLNLIRKVRKEGKRIALWGGSSKTVAFVTTLRLGQEIDQVIDINPYKQGKYLPGAAHAVSAPEALIEAPPDLILAMNAIYVPEIRESVEAMGIEATVVGVE